MQHELNDVGGAEELAGYRLNAAKEDLAAGEVVTMAENYLQEKIQEK